MPTSSTVLQVKDFIDANQLRKDMAFSDVDLDSAFMNQASLFAHYGSLHADAAYQVDAFKMALETTESSVYKILRDDFAKRAEKPTEAFLEKLVASHERVKAMKMAYNKAKRVEAICKSAVDSFRHRRDMLIQAGFAARVERQGEMRLMEKSLSDQRVASLQKEVLNTMKSD